jgi:hypothetical protein
MTPTDNTHLTSMESRELSLSAPRQPMLLPDAFINGLPPLRPRLDSDSDSEHISVRERNRVAAQRWREKKNRFITNLEQDNADLRQRAFQSSVELRRLESTNKILEEELAFFQKVVARIMPSGR